MLRAFKAVKRRLERLLLPLPKTLILRLTYSPAKHRLDLAAFLEMIADETYALVKVDVPYMPPDFPSEYPVGKDMDIITTPGAFEAVCDCAKKFAHAYSKAFDVRYRVTDYNTRIRFERWGRLHYQLDISTAYSVRADVFERVIARAIERRGFKCLRDGDECLFRLLAWAERKEKQYHRDYVLAHQDKIDRSLVEKLGADSVLQSLLKRD